MPHDDIDGTSGCMGNLIKISPIIVGVLFVASICTSPSLDRNKQAKESTGSTSEQTDTAPHHQPSQSSAAKNRQEKTEAETGQTQGDQQETRTTEPTKSDTNTATVVDVADGDTLEVRFPNGRTEEIRLLGVDTPEVHTENDPPEFEGVPNNNAGYNCLRKWGEKASRYAKRTLNGRVRVETDPQADTRGSYGRLLAYVYKDGMNFNYSLIKKGYARVYDSTFSKSRSFYQAENSAQSNTIGLWECTQVESSSDGSVSSAPAGVNCSENVYNCSDFDSYQEALRVFKACGGVSNDVHHLDGNGDGEPCESLK